MAAQVLAIPTQTNGTKTVRPTADFHPSIWGDYFLKYASEPLVYISKYSVMNKRINLQAIYPYIYIYI